MIQSTEHKRKDAAVESGNLTAGGFDGRQGTLGADSLYRAKNVGGGGCIKPVSTHEPRWLGASVELNESWLACATE